MKDSLILVILIVFVWAGMLLGISFLEAPLKFQAPHVTLSIGLGIGRLVFTALNRIEILFCVCILALFIFLKPPINTWVLIMVILSILSVQTLWLLPVLDERAEIIISGGSPKGSSPHIYYVIGEIAKTIALVTIGYGLIKKILKNNNPVYS
jgi:hypothetical protein